MNQLTFSDIEYANRKKKTKREEFLDAMEEIIPWSYWVEMIRPYYFANKRGRKPIGIETMLRMYLMQIWFNLSDEGIEDSIYDSYAMRSFMHIDFHEQQVPDATTLLKFRHMLEANKLGEKIFADVTNRLDKAGLMMHGGTIVDASLIAAPKSTKNQEGRRDPEMHQTKKGNCQTADYLGRFPQIISDGNTCHSLRSMRQKHIISGVTADYRGLISVQLWLD